MKQRPLRYIVRLWIDPCNERGMYRQIVQYYVARSAAVQAAENTEYEKALVLDSLSKVSKNSLANKVVYARGY
jgi:hypothetical protein